MMIRLLSPLLALAALLWAGAAAAEVRRDAVLTRLTAAELQDLLQSWGYAPAALPESSEGPRLQIKLQASTVLILLYDCDKTRAPVACESLQLYAGFATKGMVSLLKVNDWNLNQRWGRAYLDEASDVAIDMDVNVAEGITAANLHNTLRTFDLSLAAFKTFIGF